MKKLLSILSLVAFIPTSTFAAFNTPAELYLAAIASQNAPYSFDATMYLSVPNEGTVSITMTGEASGTTIQDAKMNAHVHVEADIEDEMDVELDAWLKMVDQTMYMRVQTNNQEIQQEMAYAGFDQSKWMMIPFGDVLMDELPTNTAELEKIQRDIAPLFNSIFDMKKLSITNGYEYTLTLKDDLSGTVEDIITLVDNFEPLTEEDKQEGREELPAILDELEQYTKDATVKVKVWTGTNDAITKQKFYGAYSNAFVDVGVDMTSTMQQEDFKVWKPALRNTVNMLDQMGLNDTYDYEEWDEDDWSDEDWSNEDWNSEWEETTNEDWEATMREWEQEVEQEMQTAEKCAEIATVSRPSRRSIKMQKLHCN